MTLRKLQQVWLLDQSNPMAQSRSMGKIWISKHFLLSMSAREWWCMIQKWIRSLQSMFLKTPVIFWVSTLQKTKQLILISILLLISSLHICLRISKHFSNNWRGRLQWIELKWDLESKFWSRMIRESLLGRILLRKFLRLNKLTL